MMPVLPLSVWLLTFVVFGVAGAAGVRVALTPGCTPPARTDLVLWVVGFTAAIAVGVLAAVTA